MTVLGTTDPMVGHVLDGRYEVLTKIARGGMATVYRAQDRRLGRVVAVKVMHEGLGDDAEFTRKFDREARSSARLVHPNIVAVFDQGHDFGRPYIVMELAEGTTLRHLIAREAPVEPLRALELMEPVVNALAYAHDSGLVHRDVKPENVLITDRGQIKVADFGLSRAITGQSASATQGLLIGTVSYLPPELVTSGRASFRSDVYSTGVVLFELLTGQKPYTGETPIQVAYAHVHNDMPAPSSRLTDNNLLRQDSRRIIPPYLDALVQAATRRRPSERPRNARELLERLRVAKRALSHGILDDPDLTEKMNPAGAEATTVTLPDPATRPLPRPRVVVPDSPAEPDWDAQDNPDNRESPEWDRPEPTPVTPLVARDERSPRSPRTPIMVNKSPVYRRRRGFAALVSMVLVGFILLGGTAWWNAVAGDVAVPALVGQTRDAAITAARAENLTLRTTEQYSETVAKGEVISTSPAADEKVKRNTEITAVVSKGPERYPVPDVVGKKRDDAAKALRDGHLEQGKVTEQYDEKVAKGIVLATSIAVGTPAKPGTAVNLTVSAGPKPIDIPIVTGKSRDDATSALEEAGFVVKTTEENSATVDEGNVISQNPAKGTGFKGSTVNIVVSKGPVMVQVPQISIGTSEKEATARIEQAGLKAKVVYGSPTWLRAGIVSLTSPGSGKQLPQGSVVTIYVV